MYKNFNENSYIDLYQESDGKKIGIPKSKLLQFYYPSDQQLKNILQQLLNDVTDEEIKRRLHANVAIQIDLGMIIGHEKNPADYHRDLYNILKKVVSGSYMLKVHNHFTSLTPFTPDLSERLVDIVEDNTNLTKDEQQYVIELIKNYTKNG